MTTTTAVDLDELARMHSTDECKLDRWKRYLMVPVGATTKKPVPHTRVTTVAKAMEDGYGVTNWRVRIAAAGFAKDNRLYAKLCDAVQTLDPNGLFDNAKIDALCDDAHQLAGGNDARDDGTLLHAFTEKADHGQDVFIPQPYRDRVDCYRRSLDELEIRVVPEYIERYVVIPGLSEPVAGRADGLAWFGSTLKVFDKKCGKVGPWSWLPWSIQLALYSRAATFYNAGSHSHEPMPEVDQDIGIICHLPTNGTDCTIYFVDLNLGWEAAQLALAVRAWRKRGESGGLAEAWRADRPSTNPDVRRGRLLERAMTLPRDQLAAAWPTGIPTFKQTLAHTSDQLDLIAMAISTVENRNQAPFATADPADI